MHALKGLLLGIAVVGIAALFLYSRVTPPKDSAPAVTTTTPTTGRPAPWAKRAPGQPGPFALKAIPPATWGKDDPRIEGPRNPSAEWVKQQLDVPQYRGRLPFIPHAGMKPPTQAEMEAFRAQLEQNARAFSPEAERQRYKANQ